MLTDSTGRIHLHCLADKSFPFKSVTSNCFAKSACDVKPLSHPVERNFETSATSTVCMYMG